MFYSQKTNGFYDIDIHGDTMPDDVVEITKEQHLFLMSGQSEGKMIQPNSNGFPALVEPSYSPEEVLKTAQANRKAAYIAESDPLFFKYQRGEATEQEWLNKVAEIKATFPKE